MPDIHAGQIDLSPPIRKESRKSARKSNSPVVVSDQNGAAVTTARKDFAKLNSNGDKDGQVADANNPMHRHRRGQVSSSHADKLFITTEKKKIKREFQPAATAELPNSAENEIMDFAPSLDIKIHGKDDTNQHFVK